MTDTTRLRQQFAAVVAPSFPEHVEPQFTDSVPRVVEFQKPDGTTAYRYADSAPPAAVPAGSAPRISTRLVNVALTSFIAAAITTALHFAQGSIEALSHLVASVAHLVVTLGGCAVAVAIVFFLISIVSSIKGSRGNRTQRINVKIKGRRNRLVIKQ